MVLRHQRTVMFDDEQDAWLQARAERDKVSVPHVIRAAVQREMTLVPFAEDRLSPEANALYHNAEAMGGVEVPESDWPLAVEIVNVGLGTLSSARGPNQQWKRLEITQ